MTEVKMTEVLKKNGLNNRGKTYFKSPYKKKIIKYVTLQPGVEVRLEEVAKQTGLSQSYLISLALMDYLEKFNTN